MYDKHLLAGEIQLIRRHIPDSAKVLDVGCGEGEGTLVYSKIPGTMIHATDFSGTRLKKAAERLKGVHNVVLKKIDFLGRYSLDNDYDIIVSQRFLINVTEWRLQRKVLLDLVKMLKPEGKLIMLEGSKQGAESLNAFRELWGLDRISEKWHNLFFDDEALVHFMQDNGCNLIAHEGFGVYFLLTRGIRPIFDKDIRWDCTFNRIAASEEIKNLLRLDSTELSRLKLWVFQM